MLGIIVVSFVVVQLLFRSTAGSPLGVQDASIKGLFDEPEVFLTISSEAGVRGGTFLDRRLELNWNNFAVEYGDYVGLFDFDVTLNPNSNAQSFHEQAKESVPVNTTRGYYRTLWRYERNDNISALMGENCVGYWIAYIRLGQDGTESVLMSNCLKTRPTWMNDIKEIIGDKSLHSILIPGTHNAGSWKHYNGVPSENPIIRYSICQEDSIYEQLVHGIRYLDVRVAHYPQTEEKFWVNHDTIRIGPLIDLINDVKRFTMETKEIVFMDFHRFPVGFTSPSIHYELVQFVQQNIGYFLAPKQFSNNVTPNQLWNTNRTVILTYADESVSSQHDVLWPNLRQAWGDKNEVETLGQYLNDVIPELGCTQRFWAAMGQITPTAEDIIFKPLVGLRGFAQLVNINLTFWYQQPSWYSKSMIVTTDFYLGSNIIEIALKVNRNGGACL